MCKNKKRVAPDGGWGWIILIVFVVNGTFIACMEQNFILLVKETFKSLHMTGTSIASIVSTCGAVGELIGVCTGPLVKRFGIRTVAIVGSFSFTIGVTTTAFAESYIQFMMCYGIFVGVGIGIIRLTTSLSINSYFYKKRRKVVGVGLAMRSVGFTFFPHFVIFLLSYYGISSTMLLLGGIFSHAVCMSLLLKPVEWYMIANEHISAVDVELPLCKEEETEYLKANNSSTILKRLTQCYDLTLFTNRVFLTTSCGVMCSSFAERGFYNLLPLILTDLGLEDTEIATFMSTSFTANIIVRFTCPFFGDYFKRSTRFMYGLGCIVAVIPRFVIIYVSKTTKCIAIPILSGVAYGIIIVHRYVIFADNVPLEKLPSAESISMVLQGITTLVCGPLIGMIKDAVGTYVSCVYALNALTLFTLVLWLIECIICCSFKRRRNGMGY